MCGKDFLKNVLKVMSIGSPPHVREGLELITNEDLQNRITPARAGRTLIPRTVCLCNRDHPRSRGKDLNYGYLSATGGGSPPLAREGQC